MTKPNWIESALVNNFVWSMIQRKYIVPFWMKTMNMGAGGSILEVGCGRGAGAVILYETFKPKRLDAFDIDEKMVNKARKFISGGYEDKIFVTRGDVTRIAAEDATYDGVFDFFILHHVEDWGKGLSEISRVLKPGGFFAFGEVYGSAIRQLVIKNILAHPHEERFDRAQLVRGLAENRLRLMENKINIGDWGIIGVSKKS